MSNHCWERMPYYFGGMDQTALGKRLDQYHDAAILLRGGIIEGYTILEMLMDEIIQRDAFAGGRQAYNKYMEIFVQNEMQMALRLDC